MKIKEEPDALMNRSSAQLSDDELSRIAGGENEPAPVEGTPMCFCNKEGSCLIPAPDWCNTYHNCPYYDDCTNHEQK